MKKDPSVFDTDLRYLSSNAHVRPRNFGRPHHWLAGLAIAVAVGIWLGSAPDASVERKSPTLRLQIESVVEQDRTPIDFPPLQTGVSVLPTFEDFRGMEFWPAIRPGIEINQETPQGTPARLASTTEPSVKSDDVAPGSTRSTSSQAHISPLSDHSSGNIGNSEAADQTSFETIQIKPGDSLVRIFKRLKLDIAQAIEISKIPTAKALSQLKPGPYLKIKRQGSQLLALRYQPTIKQYLDVVAQNDTFVAETIDRAFDIQQKEVTVEITDTLFESAKRAGLPSSVAYRVTEIFQWEVDFSSDVHRGDQLAVIFEEQWLDNQKIGLGPVLAARLETGSKTHHAIRHVDSNGQSTYYTPEGDSLQRAFLRSPVPGASVSSGFSYRRLHPILKVRRPHLGVDYGARKGTPVVATADGKVIRASRKGGYGKTIILRHGQDYRTLYAHLSGYAKGVRSGKWVKKGQVIGYVGSTGLSTGPHLHYEIHVAGKAKNPQTLKFPRSASISANEKDSFLEASKTWLTRLEAMQSAG